MRRAYDEKCLELARYFLADKKGARAEDISELALWFQDSAEAMIQEIEKGEEV